MQYIILFLSTLVQNASFTLVSRARNSNSIPYHAFASVVSNLVWWFVIRQVVVNMNDWVAMLTYVTGGTIGALLMHYVAIHHIEKKKP